MTTNQTIDGVSRRMLTALLCHVSELENRALVDELRALLDVPATEERGSSHGFEQNPNTCRHDERSGVWWREGSITRTGRECCACGSVEEDPVELAAQPQGDPVAIVDEGDDGLFIEFIYGENGNPLQRGNKLYAEQPAPVAVVQIAGFNVVEDPSIPPGQIRMCDCNQGRLPCTCKPSAYDGFDNGVD